MCLINLLGIDFAKFLTIIGIFNRENNLKYFDQKKKNN